ncbi:MAG: hypothetical protein KF686_15010 [Ramlibacter sp.]|nr:hypothetical protein [Ramlibacter sp.]
MSYKPLVFVQLNEVNFDTVRRYVEKYNDLPAFKVLLRDFVAYETFGEDRYHELEPWIQWVSAQTGKTFAEHGVFRLGDIVDKPDSLLQIFEILESKGLKVGAVSPMNARNRLKNPAFFVPDPWTDTPSDNCGFSQRLTQMMRQTVNDNAAGRITGRSIATLAEAVIRSFHPKRTLDLLRLLLTIPKKPWKKSLVLDQLVHMVHLRLFRRSRPNVSFVFLNAGAHIQHHYFLNAEIPGGARKNPAWYIPLDADPVRDMLHTYDRILSDYLALQTEGTRIILATGLTQEPYRRVKFYYRIREHEAFLNAAGIGFQRVLPRMTRDFEITFSNDADANAAAVRLASMRMARDGQPVFKELEQRPRSLFVTLTYPDEIQPDDAIDFKGGRLDRFGDLVAFVAIKNGMHNTRGFVFTSPSIAPDAYPNRFHVSRLFDLTMASAMFDR